MYRYVVGGVVTVLVLGGAGWYVLFGTTEDKYADAIFPRDLSQAAVPPVVVPMRGYTFQVPHASTSELTTELTLVAPSATRNYPMGRFSYEGESGSLWALDDFTTEATNRRRAVPIAVEYSNAIPMYYLAIVDEVDGGFRHATSVPLDEGIRIRSTSLNGSEVTVRYQTHARGQNLEEVPTVDTAAIIDIADGRMVQRGRQPRTEVVQEVRAFSGVYVWTKTEYADGAVVEPVAPGAFTLTFDARRLRLATDCNDGTADFEPSTTTAVSVGPVTATQRFCTSEQEAGYFAMVTALVELIDDTDGVYTFALADEEGTMTFVPRERQLEFANEASATSAEDAVESGNETPTE